MNQILERFVVIFGIDDPSSLISGNLAGDVQIVIANYRKTTAKVFNHPIRKTQLTFRISIGQIHSHMSTAEYLLHLVIRQKFAANQTRA